MAEQLRIGILGTGRVASYGIIQPAASTPEVTVAAVASRSLEKAQAFAKQFSIGRSHGTYSALIEDTDIDAIYVALPPALHPMWVRAALDAGKHVLCEKPLAPNAKVAEELVAHARARNRVLQEGLHIRFMNRLQRQRDRVASGELGRIVRIESCFRLPKIPMADGDFRLSYELGGGAALDIGCYAASCLLFIAGESGEVTGARCRLAAPEVDRWIRADIRLASGAAARCECGFRGWYRARLDVRVECEHGRIWWDKDGLVYRREGMTIKEPIKELWTYHRQLDAFLRKTRGEASYGPTPEESVAAARLVDGRLTAAGLSTRQPLETM